MADQEAQNGEEVTRSGGQVQVHFVTEEKEFELEESKRVLLVPTDIRRYNLSQILNSPAMLDLPNPTPFDILINGTFLRTTLAEYLVSAGLSAETTLTLQFLRSSIPPTFTAAFEHDDWVAAVDVLSATSPHSSAYEKDPRILSGSYDGLLRMWSPSGTVIATSPGASNGGHTSSIKAAKFLSPTTIASAGLDRTVRIWSYADAAGPDEQGKLTPTLALYGHTLPIDSLAAHTPSNRILSASADGSIGLWTPNKSAPAAPSALLPGSAPSAKRRKMNAAVDVPARGATSMMAAHTAPATGVVFHPDDATAAYSTSLDHTLKTLDLATGNVVDTRATGHALLCLTTLAPGGSGHVVAVGSAARHITLIDPRAGGVVMTLRGHKNKIASLARDPGSAFGLVSGAHDGTVRVWDVRSSREGNLDEGGRVGEAVFVVGRDGAGKSKVGGEGEKVFGVVWDQTVGIVSAGEDRRVQINAPARLEKS
ncbi:hypothetical protein V493_06206 [Pseudogymnoascus sp. VKM F-4281 (FW-2241)]|nr:hypothetical protein V493_06206 [Pseudogymnoascus sp. VKM F-4281 (FW-2241)]